MYIRRKGGGKWHRYLYQVGCYKKVKARKRIVQFSLEPRRRNSVRFNFLVIRVTTLFSLSHRCETGHGMDGVIVLLLSVMAVQVGSSAQLQSGLPRPGLIRQSSVPYANHRRSWPANSLTYDERDGESYQSGSDGHNRLAQLKKKMSKWLKKREKNKKSEPDAFDPDNMVIVLDAATPAFDQQFSANGSIPDDGCDSNSVRFDDGQCYLLLGRQPCKDPRHWVTVDSSTNKVCKLKGDVRRLNNNILIRGGALRAFAEETGYLLYVRDFVTTFTTHPSAGEAVVFTIPNTENRSAIVPSVTIHSRTLRTIASDFLPKVFKKIADH